MNVLYVKEILKEYFNDNHDIVIEELREGLTNYNYKINIGGFKKYFLKIFRSANLVRVKGIIGLIQTLRDYNFPTPDIIPLLDGTFYWSNNKNIAIMTEFIEGRYPEKNMTELYQIGNILGALHQVPANIELIKGYSLNYENQLENIRESGDLIEDDLLLFMDKVAPILETIDNIKFPESIIHGDVFLDNLLLNEFGDLYFIDFEGGCIDKSLFDLSRAVIGCAIIHNRIDLGLTRALVAGYNVVRNLEPVELDYLYEYIVYAGAVSTFWRYNEFNIRRYLEDKKHLYRRLMNPVTNFLQVRKDEFREKIFSEHHEI